MSVKPVHKRAFVIGGTGGVGRAMIEALLDNGYDLTISYHSNQALAQSLASAHPGRIAVAPLDLADTIGLAEAVRACLATTPDGWFDTVVLAAGLAGGPQLLARGKSERVALLSQVNFTGQIMCVQALLQQLVKKGGGRPCSFVAISSVSAVEAQPGMTVYAAAKAGMEHFFRCCAAEYRPWGFRFNIVRSGPVRTDMIDSLPERAREEMARRLDGAVIPAPGQLGSFVVFAASPERSPGMNGAVLHVDNGYSLGR